MVFVYLSLVRFFSAWDVGIGDSCALTPCAQMHPNACSTIQQHICRVNACLGLQWDCVTERFLAGVRAVPLEHSIVQQTLQLL